MNNCRSCRAEIRWARTENGKLMPLDYDPNPEGNVTVADGHAVVHGPLELLLLDPHRELFMPHHATCPNADEWRKR